MSSSQRLSFSRVRDPKLKQRSLRNLAPRLARGGVQRSPRAGLALAFLGESMQYRRPFCGHILGSWALAWRLCRLLFVCGKQYVRVLVVLVLVVIVIVIIIMIFFTKPICACVSGTSTFCYRDHDYCHDFFRLLFDRCMC